MSTLTSRGAGLFLLLLFIVSGFAGLIYQSVWSQYLGLVLGHAAYAQTLVLAIFMGGMAIGAWFVSQRTPSWRRLIFGYAIVEGLIGIVGLSFQGLFEFYTDFSQQIALPAIGEASIAHLYQWITAGLLILPQSLLLGATFPLLSAGYLRVAPREDGQVLGGLYFSNSLGAALGALLTTFLLLPAFGLPGTVMAAGILNLLVAAGAWAVSKAMAEGDASRETAPPPAVSGAERSVSDDRLRYLTKVMLAATAISGATSFVYELGWIRMLNQALGTTIHSFELMLTAFILGLAFGGLWIRRRSSGITDSIRYVGYAQVLMGIAALLSIPVFTQSFRWVGWLMEALSRTENGYVLYELGTAAISLLVMFPAAFFAGMTLPLFTMSLLRSGADERAIGRIYAANTLGAIAGVAVMVHVLVPLMGVKLSVTLAAAVDALLGLYLLHIALAGRVSRGAYAAAGALALALVASSLLGRIDPTVQTSGVFRTGWFDANPAQRVLYLKDGKTATVAVNYYTKDSVMNIMTNGKSDAGMVPLDQPAVSDETTMSMLGVMPLIAHPDPKEIAVIGWGSGLSTHTLLGSPVPQQVDTIEIEKAMYEGAKLFGERVERAYKDPRSKARFEDARTFFSTGKRQYDVIVSEPSNPWVSGVANLFTQEFYRFLKGHLKDDGVLVQWLHLYEIDDYLVATMLAALLEEFPDVRFYLINWTDLLIVSYKDSVAPLSGAPWQEEALSGELRRVGLGGLDEVISRRIGGADVIRTYVKMQAASPYSDYYPVVSLQAPKVRFMGKNVTFLRYLVTNGMPVLDMLECRRPLPAEVALDATENLSPFGSYRALGMQVKKMMLNGQSADLDESFTRFAPTILHALSRVKAQSVTPENMGEWSEGIATLAEMTIGLLDSQDLRNVWIGTMPWLPEGMMENPQIAAVLRAYASAAARDAQGMYEDAKAVLAMPDTSFDPRLREQMLVIGILGSMASGHMDEVRQLEAKYGGGCADNLIVIRGFLQTWADQKLPVCAASVQ